MPDLRERYNQDQIRLTTPQRDVSGICSAVELSALKYILEQQGQDIPWTTIQFDNVSARAVQIGDLPSYLLQTEEQLLIALPQEDGLLQIRPFESATLFMKYQTLHSISSNPLFDPSPTLHKFIESLDLQLFTHSITPSQEFFQQLFSKSIKW